MLGVCCALARRLRSGRDNRVTGLPSPDWASLILLVGIVVVGFALEAMRIAMTGWPVGSQYAFLGSALSLVFSPGEALQTAYGYIRYGHALLTALFVAYLPFSRMLHMILAPVLAMINGCRGPR